VKLVLNPGPLGQALQPAGGDVKSSPAGIDCTGGSSGCQASYTDGTAVTLTATPDANSDFTGWTGDGCSGAQPTCTVAMSQARSVTASFSRKSALPGSPF
jgi:uncharacterized repeat protein (TIGR02543 family)